MNSCNCYIHFGWIECAGFGLLSNSSTASWEGTQELYSSNLGTSLFLAIS